ncbi:DUF6182 family protein [Actinomadura fibrosa]|uniref:DUF6182 family protein n=1 Tax=Actinomadura fibrosa TaxID=111802 RepID=A0ABW2XSM1_9ACTN|nr:DUF6182 family protein [Actinomadura fibrosa]
MTPSLSAADEPAVVLSQVLLRAEVTRRIRSARPDLAADLDLSAPGGLDAAARRAADAADLAAVAVVHRFDLASWIRASCGFALGLDPAAGAGWRRSFTRTIILAGNPGNLGGRVRFDHRADDGSSAWLAPGPPDRVTGLRRLLKPFDGPGPLPPPPTGTIRVPGEAGNRPPVRHGLHIATAGTTVSRCMIGLNHLLAEAVLDGLVRPGDRLALHRAPRLGGLAGPFTALRVEPDPRHDDRLQALACLTEERPDARTPR